ncbi:transposase [Sphingosinithalassobacter portus]|nr:transposase [Sphingosinithalassobacter portus]
MDTGSPWRSLPERFGNWSTAFRRFRKWRDADVFKRIFDALSAEPDM